MEVSFTPSSGEAVKQLLSAQPTRGKALHQLAVKHALREWEDGGLHLHHSDPLAVREALSKEAAVKLSKEFGVACKATSWVLKGTDVQQGAIVTMHVPLPPPAQSAMFGAFAGQPRTFARGAVFCSATVQ